MAGILMQMYGALLLSCGEKFVMLIDTKLFLQSVAKSGDPPRNIVVAMDVSVTKDQLALDAPNWANNNLARPRDTLTILGTIHSAASSTFSISSLSILGYKSKTDQSLAGVNIKRQDEEIMKTALALCSREFKQIRSACDEKKVFTTIKIVPGFPSKAVVLQIATSLNATWVVLDRYMKKDKKYLCEKLVCNIASVNRHGKGKVLKLVNMGGIDDIDRSLDLSEHFEIPDKTASQTSLSTSLLARENGEETFCMSIDYQSYTDGHQSDSDSSVAARAQDELQPGSPNTVDSAEDDSLSGSMSRVRSLPSLQMFSPDQQGIRSSVSVERASSNLKGRSTPFSSSQLTIHPAPVPIISVKPRRPAADISVLKLLESEELEFDPWQSPFRTKTSSQASSMCSINDLGTSSVITVLCSYCNNVSPRFGKPPSNFTYSQLEEATNGFSLENLLAEGGFGFVYRGRLRDGQMVAVKQHKPASSQGDREFRAEVEVLSCAQHRNLVTLIGYCTEGGRRILVYEYVCNRSLDRHLSRHNSNPLDWKSRHKVAVGAARGLRYLHEECGVGCIVHRDFRPNNILLTHDFTALVGDFGLARWQANGATAEETRVIGTIGYVAPEYAESGQITEKADVFSYGLVLLELITGYPAFDASRSYGQQHLSDWAWPLLENGAVHELLDARLMEFDEYELRCMLHAARLCIHKDPRKRPRISQVVRIIEGQ